MTSDELVAKGNRKGFSRAEPSFLNHWTSQPRNTQRHGRKTHGAIFRTWQCYRWLAANFRNAVGACMGLSVPVPNGYLTVVFNWLLTWKNMFAFPWMRILLMYWSPGLFLWMVQPKSRFRNLKRVHGTTQEFVYGTFRSVNSKAFCWPNTSSR